MNKVFQNYRDHPSLKFDGLRLVFNLNNKVFLIEDGIVKNIEVTSIEETNIGEPFRKLVRLNFLNIGESGVYEDCIDFHISEQKDLEKLMNRIDSTIIKPEDFNV